MNSFDFSDDLYNEHFEKTYQFLKLGIKDDLEKEIEALNNTIESLMTYQGNDWIGRGELLLIKTNATIAASEVLKSELEEALLAQRSYNHDRK